MTQERRHEGCCFGLVELKTKVDSGIVPTLERLENKTDKIESRVEILEIESRKSKDEKNARSIKFKFWGTIIAAVIAGIFLILNTFIK